MREVYKNFQNCFFYLPFTTDRKEKVNKFFNNVQLPPIDCLYDDFNRFSSKNLGFLMQNLDSHDLEKRQQAREIVINFSKEAVQASNSNLMRNANALLVKGEAKVNPEDEFSWVGKSHYQNQDKIKLTY